MTNDFAAGGLYSQKYVKLPNVNSLLKISFGLILLTMISSASVYAETISVDIGGDSFDIEYTATGMTVSGINPDLEIQSLILSVDVTESTGVLDVTFERSFFDAIFKGLDEEFIVLADDDEQNFSEIDTNSNSRTLSIELPAGTEEIEIIGSEFGNLSSNTIPDTDDADKAAADKAAADKAAADKAAADKAAADKAAADKAAADKAAADKAAADKAAADKAAADKAAADKAAADKATADKAAADKAAADKAAADKAAAANKCGPGTILKDGTCVLDDRCGPGTILQNDKCVLDPKYKSPDTSIKGLGKDLGMGLAIAFAGAGVIAVVFAIVSKASKNS